MGYTGRGLTWQCKCFFSQRAPCWMQLWRKLTSFSDDCDYGLMCHNIVHQKKSFFNILDISWIFMKSPTQSDPVYAVTRTSKRQEWKQYGK